MNEEKIKSYVVEAVANNGGRSRFYSKYFLATTKREALEKFLRDYHDSFNSISVIQQF